MRLSYGGEVMARRAFLRLAGGVALPLALIPVGARVGRDDRVESVPMPELVIRDGWVLRASDLDRPA